jgi:hypothetical protein
MRQALCLVILMGVVGCGSDKSTEPFVPIKTEQLVGRWEGSYSLTYNTGTDSSYTFQTDMWIVFTDSSFEFRGDDRGPCGTWGGGSYDVEDDVLWFRDERARLALCSWENVLEGKFTYSFNPDVTKLFMTQRLGEFLWRVELTRTPVIVPF